MASEFLRPWKLFSFGCGIGLLVAGSLYYKAPDWDIGISLIMGTLTYLTAPWALAAIRSRSLGEVFGALLAFWITVDGSYFYYNAMNGHLVEPKLRAANFFASSLLYILCGWIWTPRLQLREVLYQLKATLTRR